MNKSNAFVQNPSAAPLFKPLEQNEFDLAAIGRALLSDPAWANKVREGRYEDIQPFSPEVLANLK
ncbi:hypothetical protein [Paenibacillus apii]|uniref:hypothetical protein n=1 Tax=Paenibacillus apii TaxID=1850370 RepID=UPI0019807B75